jgi:transcriptional regulator with XRE-family HTH domain
VPSPVAKLPTEAPSREKLQLTLGAAIRSTRLLVHLTQEQLAERAGLHHNYVSSVERGERNLSLYNIVRIAHGLGVTASELMQSLERDPDWELASL